jgi:hypothetical protein
MEKITIHEDDTPPLLLLLSYIIQRMLTSCCMDLEWGHLLVLPVISLLHHEEFYPNDQTRPQPTTTTTAPAAENQLNREREKKLVKLFYWLPKSDLLAFNFLSPGEKC